MPQFPPLQENIHVEVCIVGAGISGLTTAYLLAKAGRQVAVLDDGPVAGGMTQRTKTRLDGNTLVLRRPQAHRCTRRQRNRADLDAAAGRLTGQGTCPGMAVAADAGRRSICVGPRAG